MKKVLYLSLAFLATVLLAMPAAAQRAGGGKSGSSGPSMDRDRSNHGGQVRGNERAEEVQQMNKRADAHRGFSVAPGVEKAESKKHKKHHDDADRDKDKTNANTRNTRANTRAKVTAKNIPTRLNHLKAREPPAVCRFPCTVSVET